MTLYKNEFRVETSRLIKWDYSSNGFYYITICVHNHERVFGKIQNGTMILSDLGKIAENYWRSIPEHFAYVKLDEFIIMPDHIHGIIKIQKPARVSDFGVHIVETPNLGVSTETQTEMETQTKLVMQTGTKNQPNIGIIINQYKRICTINIRKSIPTFKWQPRFHDHVIRDYYDLNRIRKYIIDNPANWENKINTKGCTT